VKRDFTLVTDFSRQEILELFRRAGQLKSETHAGIAHPLLQGHNLAMLFQKPSTRTRVSFEVAMNQLGGHALYLSPAEVGLGQRESVADVARVLSRYCTAIMARVFGHDIIVQLAAHAAVPVINGLSDLAHPCQVLGDLFTVIERKGDRDDLKVAFVGDGNNVANSWINLASIWPVSLTLSTPPDYSPDAGIIERARAGEGGRIHITEDPHEAVRGADVIYTDVWASMGQEDEAAERQRVFADYRVDRDLLKSADPDCLVMHCLPAHRGQEITDDVIDGPHSVVFDQAENRLHIQKAILLKLLVD